MRQDDYDCYEAARMRKPFETVSTKDDKEILNPLKTVYKARDIIDGKFLEDYFYNS